MRGAGCEPNVTAYSAAILACASAGQPAKALQLFEEAQRNVEMTASIYNAVLDAVCTSHPEKARELYKRGRGLIARDLYTRSLTDTTTRRDSVVVVHPTKNDASTWNGAKLDLHSHSEGAGDTALRWWLEERMMKTSEHERLDIVTGWGKSRTVLSHGDLHGRVERVLAELCVPTLRMDNNGGRFAVDVPRWRRQQERSNVISPTRRLSAPRQAHHKRCAATRVA